MAVANLEDAEELDFPKCMTWEEFLCWEPEHKHWEWVDGEVIKIMASIPHQRLLMFLARLLSAFVDAHQLGEVFVAPTLVRMAFRPAGREPDLFFVSHENAVNLTEQFLDGPADLVIEIVSPESDHRDKVDKLAEYERIGVREYWILDYLQQETFFYQRNERGLLAPVAANEDGCYDSVVLPGFRLNLNWLWQEPKPLAEAMQALKILQGA